MEETANERESEKWKSQKQMCIRSKTGERTHKRLARALGPGLRASTGILLISPRDLETRDTEKNRDIAIRRIKD